MIMDYFEFVPGLLAFRVALGAPALLFLAFLIRYFLSRPRALKLPVAEGEPKHGNYSEMLLNAINKYPHEPFILPLPIPTIVLPSSMLEVTKNLTERDLSMHQDVMIRMHGKYTGIGSHHPQAVAAISNELTRNISRTLSEIQEEATVAFDSEVGECPEWTEFSIYSKLLRIVSLVGGRVFVGLPLCRDEKWIDITINCTVNVVEAFQTIETYPSILRPFLIPFNTKLRKLYEYRAVASQMLAPQVNAIVAERELHPDAKISSGVDEDDDDDDTERNHFNMIHWIINHYNNPSDATALSLAEEQMLIAFAAIHTTSIQTFHNIFHLAAYPEYIEELRAEIDDVIAEENYPDRKLRKTSIPKLKKLDSFLKETQRVKPLGMLTAFRVVTSTSGLKLPNGTTLPRGTHIAFAPPCSPGVREPPPSILLTCDDQPPLTEFHPFRFSNIRSIPGEENKHQFVTTGGAESIGFGHGHWTCPGRFFASNEIKVIVIELLKRYDVALGPDGESVKDGWEMPVTLSAGTEYYPDPGAKVYFRRKEGLECLSPRPC